MNTNNYETIKQLAKEYQEVIEISETDALKNAEYIFNNVTAKDEFGEVLSKENLKPIVRFIERIYDKEKAVKVINHFEEFGSAPDWAKDGDYGFTGEVIPYLKKFSSEKNDNVYLVALKNSGFRNEDGVPVLAKSKITQIKDLGGNK